MLHTRSRVAGVPCPSVGGVVMRKSADESTSSADVAADVAARAAAAAARRAALSEQDRGLLQALENERIGYVTRGLDARVQQVDAQIHYLQGGR